MDEDRPEVELHEEEEHRAQLRVIEGAFGNEPSDRETEPVELTTADITEAEKVEFIQLIRQGFNRQEAANALGYYARPWRALTSPESRYYDEAFADAYADAKGSPEAKLHYLERLREETDRRALLDSDRLLEKLMLIHDPDWVPLRQKDVNVNIHAYIQQHFKDLPTDLLKQLLDALDRQSAGEIVEGDFKELPPAGDKGGDRDAS